MAEPQSGRHARPARRKTNMRTCLMMRRATDRRATDPLAADALWARVERRVLAAAPAIPLTDPIDTHLVSARVRNDRYNPQWGFLPDQAWVR